VLILPLFFYILFYKENERGNFLATSKSKHKRKQHQFKMRAKRRKERQGKVAPAVSPPPEAPKS
jgi:hypothetical protein